MKLVNNWKKALQMTSVQMALLVIALEWGNNLINGMPETPQQWVQSIVVLALPVARLLKQTKVSGE